MTHEGKPFYASKTLWFNLLSIAGVLGTAFGVPECSGTEWFGRTENGICLSLSGEGLTAATATVMAVVNAVLRLTTKEPVAMKRRKQ